MDIHLGKNSRHNVNLNYSGYTSGEKGKVVLKIIPILSISPLDLHNKMLHIISLSFPSFTSLFNQIVRLKLKIKLRCGLHKWLISKG